MNKINHDAGIRLHSRYWQAIVMVSTFFTSRTREIPHQANKQPEHILQRGQFWHLGYKSTHYFLIKKEKKPCKQLGLQFIKHLLFFFFPWNSFDTLVHGISKLRCQVSYSLKCEIRIELKTFLT